MLILSIKLLTTITLPLLALIFWQRRSKAAWSIASFALLDAIIATAIRRAIRPLIFYNSFFLSPALFMGDRLDPGVLTLPLIYGVIRLTPPLLIFLFAAKNMRSWKDAVLYGIARTTFVILIGHCTRIYNRLAVITFASQTTPDDQQPAYISVLETINNLTLNEIVEELNSLYRWTGIAHLTINWSFAPMALSIAIATALLYTVRHKKLWPLAAALACYYLMVESDLKISESQFVIDLIRAKPWLAKLITPWNSEAFFIALHNVTPILAAIPSIYLAKHIHKKMRGAPEQTTG